MHIVHVMYNMLYITNMHYIHAYYIYTHVHTTQTHTHTHVYCIFWSLKRCDLMLLFCLCFYQTLINYHTRCYCFCRCCVCLFLLLLMKCHIWCYCCCCCLIRTWSNPIWCLRCGRKWSCSRNRSTASLNAITCSSVRTESSARLPLPTCSSSFSPAPFPHSSGPPSAAWTLRGVRPPGDFVRPPKKEVLIPTPRGV